MPKPIIYLLAFLIFIGCAVFVYGISVAICVSWCCEGSACKIAPFLSSAVTSTGAILATNLGAVLGITINNPASNFRQSKSWNPLTFFSNPSPTIIQTAACYVYILSLLASAIVWAHRGFDGTETTVVVPLIQEMTKSLLGVIVGALAVALNTKNK
jgi:hypothetical protein